MSNHRNPNRRDLLKTTGLAAAGLAMSPLLLASARRLMPDRRRRSCSSPDRKHSSTA